MLFAGLASALDALIVFGVGPAIVLVVGYVLNRTNTRRSDLVRKELGDRSDEVKEALDVVKIENSTQHLSVAETVAPLLEELRDFRQEFRTYRVEHNREHALLTEKVYRRNH